MKYLILLLAFSFISSASNAQNDTCCEKITDLQNIQKNIKHPYRSILRSSSNQNITITELDSFSNLSMLSMIIHGEQKIRMEIVIYDGQSYHRTNEEEWHIRNKAETQALNISYEEDISEEQKQKKKPHNCKQLENELLDGEECYVFIYDLETPYPSMDAKKEKLVFTKSIKGKIKVWYTREGLVKKIESENIDGNKINISETKYEYDNNIIIKKPIIK